MATSIMKLVILQNQFQVFIINGIGKMKSILATGLGAHGYVEGTRYQNTRSINTYIECIEKTRSYLMIESSVLSKEEKIEEEMFLGLRLMEGINLEADFKKI